MRQRFNAIPAVCTLVLFLAPLACTSQTESPTRETGDTLPPDDSSLPAVDDSSGDDSSTHGDDSSTPDDSSVTSGDIEWTLIDSTNGPINHQWAGCNDGYDRPCDHPDVCCGVDVGIVTSQLELATFYANSLPGIDYPPELDFSSHSVVWAYLFCCTTHGPWLVVDDVTRVGRTLELSMHVERYDPAPSAFGRPWVVVQVPIGDYDGVVHNLY